MKKVTGKISKPARAKRVYMAGALFDSGDLLFNAKLAEAIGRLSGGVFECVLPQDASPQSVSAKAIRDSDLKCLLSCDAAVFNFDGTELDSGTVVEFMAAKFADIASVVLRGDFRKSGDCADASSPVQWNLMAAFYPRTELVVFDAMEVYAGFRAECLRGVAGGGGSARDSVCAAEAAIEEVAGRVLNALESIVKSGAILSGERRRAVFDWICDMPNFDAAAKREVRKILKSKLGER